MSELKHCPFCAKDPVFIENRDCLDGFVHSYEINCFECGYSIGDEYRDEAIKKWNRRRRISHGGTDAGR